MPSDQPRYKLRYLPLFWDDLDSAVAYIANVLNNPIAAENLLDSVEAKILDYSKSPTIAPIYKTTRKRPLPYYWFEVGNYMVFYGVCKTSGWKLVNLWLVAVESKSTHPTIFLTAGAAIIQPLI